MQMRLCCLELDLGPKSRLVLFSPFLVLGWGGREDEDENGEVKRWRGGEMQDGNHVGKGWTPIRPGRGLEPVLGNSRPRWRNSQSQGIMECYS